jgi:putative ABC transport system permease protein
MKILGAFVILLPLATLNPMAFFGIGFALLGLGIWLCSVVMRRLDRRSTLDSAADLALRNTTRRRGRSMATIGVLASGVFMVVAVDSFRKTGDIDATRHDSGTGGFALIGESASPIYEDLNSQKGREAYALDDKIMEGVRVVQMRVRDGDDASCLNLNRAVQPRVLGVKFGELGDGGRGALETATGGAPVPLRRFGVNWASIIAKDPVAVPSVVDANTLQWAMQKKLGDILEIPGERGEPARIQVAATVPASILQGLVLIPEDRFISIYPNSAGTRFFLIDCPPAKASAVREHLVEQLGDRGLELIPTAQRLAEFNAVENTYLSIFQVLGGLGMLLGSAGLGIVVARNVLERRREFGLLEAIGYTPAQLRSLVFAEHRWLIVAALGIGAGSALIAVLPGIFQKGAGFPWGNLALLFGGMAALSVFWTWLATRLSLRGSLLGALRNE